MFLNLITLLHFYPLLVFYSVSHLLQRTNLQSTTNYLAVSSPREVQEMDITLLLRGAAVWASDECEVDLLALNRDPATLPDSGFLLIQHQGDK